MESLQQIRPGDRLEGVRADGPVRVVGLDRHGDQAATLYFVTTGGAADQLLISAKDVARFERHHAAGRGFGADPSDFRLGLEGLRIANSHHIDPFSAIVQSRIDPYPHQVDAVYLNLLRQNPIRFLLADDPGAGKTVMAGLLIKELMLRGSVRRCLVVAPGSLVEQWQDELREKFALNFQIFSRERVEGSYGGNPFADEPLWIARLHQIARAEDLQQKVGASEWDLVVFDEAHKLSARVYASKIDKTLSYRLGELLAARSRHLLLLSATPHSGKDADFAALMALLDRDRFAGRLRPDQELPDLDGLMRRVGKDALTDFEGRRLFPDRRVATLSYRLSAAEMDLYRAVTDYVRQGLLKAQRMRMERDEIRGLAVGFALTALQRRLASSPQAIWRSLRRRHEKLQTRLKELERGEAPPIPEPGRRLAGFDEDDYADHEREALERELLEGTTAARSVEELEVELAELGPLVPLAEALCRRSDDAKWSQLRDAVLRARDVAARGSGNKLIVFSEYRDTIEYLNQRLQSEFGDPEAVLVIHGGLNRHQRRDIQDRFRVDPRARVLLATDAAGEGVNLQAAHMVVNYDLPWNPNRIEQRFGRVHRIGQTRRCYLWNLLAEGTREGQVFERLLAKIESIREVFGDSVYDVLGQAQLNRSLRELVEQALSGQDEAETLAWLQERLAVEIDTELREAIESRALASGLGQQADSEKIRRLMDRARLNRLQPYHVRAFVLAALERFGARCLPREKGRHEITRLPAALRARAENAMPLQRRYQRIAFEPERVRLTGRADAELITPSHPLTRALLGQTAATCRRSLEQGAVLLDPLNSTPGARVLFCLEHAIVGQDGEVVSKQFQYVSLDPDGQPSDPGPDPHLDYEPLNDLPREGKAREQLDDLMSARLDDQALGWAIQNLCQPHFVAAEELVRERVEKTRRLVRERLTSEIRQIDQHYQQLRARARGAEKNLYPDPRSPQADALQARLHARLEMLDRQKALRNLPPHIVAAAIVLPAALLESGGRDAPDPEAAQLSRKRTDRLAVKATLDAERALGREPEEQTQNNPGFDVLSRDPRTGREYFIEVKGHLPETEQITISATQVLHSKSAPDSWRLSLVEVPRRDGEAARVRYLVSPFEEVELGPLNPKISVEVAKLEQLAGDPA